MQDSKYICWVALASDNLWYTWKSTTTALLLTLPPYDKLDFFHLPLLKSYLSILLKKLIISEYGAILDIIYYAGPILKTVAYSSWKSTTAMLLTLPLYVKLNFFHLLGLNSYLSILLNKLIISKYVAILNIIYYARPILKTIAYSS